MKNIISIISLAAVMTVCTMANAQTYWSLSGNSGATSTSYIGPTGNYPFTIKTNGSVRMKIDEWKIGMGTASPISNLHLHSTYAPIPDPGITPITGITPQMGYENTFRMTNPNTGATTSDGFSIFQENEKVTIRQNEADELNIYGYSGSGLTIMTNGTTQMGNGGAHAMVYAGSFSSSTTSANTSYIGFNVKRSFSNSWNLQTNGTDNGGAAIWADAQGNLMFANIGSTGAQTQGLTGTALKNRVNLVLRNNGQLQAKEVKVTLSDWPDYVFGEDYKLMSLGETEQYIKENGHLPGVPSAQTVEEEGLSLGEMNARLMQKVEELTLHVIELQKQIDELKK